MLLETPIDKAPLPDPYTSYNHKASTTDRNFVKDCNETVDSMMVFVSNISHFWIERPLSPRIIGRAVLSSYLNINRRDLQYASS